MIPPTITARFANGKPIMTFYWEDVANPEEYNALLHAKDADGRIYKLVKVPCIKYRLKKGGDYGIYTNLYVGNEVVHAPAFGDPNDKSRLTFCNKSTLTHPQSGWHSSYQSLPWWWPTWLYHPTTAPHKINHEWCVHAWCMMCNAYSIPSLGWQDPVSWRTSRKINTRAEHCPLRFAPSIWLWI